MTDKMKNIAVTCVMALLFFGLGLFCVAKPADDYSDAERRALAKLPELSVQSLLSGEFMEDFEDYATDQFPLRDSFRSVKAYSERLIFLRSDVNDLVIRDGSITKLEYPLNEAMVESAAEKFSKIYETYFAERDSRVYLSVVPDKNYYLAESEGILALDYARLVELMRAGTDFAEYIDLFPQLEFEDYYRTDSHWRQERIADVAEHIAAAMGVTLGAQYEQTVAESEFYGVYYGQAAVKLAPERLIWLENPELEGLRVNCWDSGSAQPMALYDEKLASGRDGYESFLGGAKAVITIENPNAETDRELILFRDSFGSSLAPLLAEGYAKITLVDIRYIRSDILDMLVDMEADDVLFLYSSTMLNNSSAFK